MKMLTASVRSLFAKYITFSGRASRAEYWWVTFAVTLISITQLIFPLIGLVFLLLFVPILALIWRRMHDLGKPGWLGLVINFIPFVGFIIFLVWMCSRGTEGDNKFGPPPALIERSRKDWLVPCILYFLSIPLLFVAAFASAAASMSQENATNHDISYDSGATYTAPVESPVENTPPEQGMPSEPVTPDAEGAVAE